MCRAAVVKRGGGRELEQIQLPLGHAPVQTTERYLGTKQDLVPDMHSPSLAKLSYFTFPGTALVRT